ncbi:MAG: adenylosuccinate lyase [Anaerolineales bacterium]|nr:adenylosuccinate lyase [Anaerolineales bacterium]
MTNPLHALSPLDGRYADATAPLRDHFSEFAFLRDRVRIELDLLSALSKTGLTRPLSASETALLPSLSQNFSLADAEAIQAFERETRHDVKAIEYFLREKLQSTSLNDMLSWLHFGLTSEDVNNIAQAISLRDSRDAVLLPVIHNVLHQLTDFAKAHRALPMLARTHGQPAVPTTLGKEIAVYIARLQKAAAEIAAHKFEAKLTGAVGNLNALHSAAPQVDWLQFSADFISSYGFEPNFATNQILPYDNWVRYFDALRMFNSILIDFSQDMWRYISDDYLKQAVVAGEVGSSTMPQKVNPIDFENAEGNLGVANALFVHYAQKLMVSRLQRDLSDSTVRRTFGAALGHTLLAWTNLQRGMKRIAPNEEKLTAELNAHWEIISEGAQTILRAVGRSDAYETLKHQTRGRALTEADFRSWLETLDVDEATLIRLRNLSVETYLGFAIQLTDRIIKEFAK